MEAVDAVVGRAVDGDQAALAEEPADRRADDRWVISVIIQVLKVGYDLMIARPATVPRRRSIIATTAGRGVVWRCVLRNRTRLPCLIAVW